MLKPLNQMPKRYALKLQQDQVRGVRIEYQTRNGEWVTLPRGVPVQFDGNLVYRVKDTVLDDDNVSYTADDIAKACANAGITDSQFEDLLIELAILKTH